MNARHVTSLLQPPQQEAPPPTEEPVIEYKYVPPVSKPWLSYGSEQEVDAARITSKRPLVRTTVTRSSPPAVPY